MTTLRVLVQDPSTAMIGSVVYPAFTGKVAKGESATTRACNGAVFSDCSERIVSNSEVIQLDGLSPMRGSANWCQLPRYRLVGGYSGGSWHTGCDPESEVSCQRIAVEMRAYHYVSDAVFIVSNEGWPENRWLPIEEMSPIDEVANTEIKCLWHDLSLEDPINMEVFPRFDLNGQVALVTGAARGLGRAISLALAAAGADVALGLRDVNAAGGLPAEIRALGRRVLPLQMDMTRLDQITSAIDHVVRDFGRLDILVNNAGVAPGNRAEDVSEADFDFTLAVNLKGTFFACQAAGRVMIRQKSGRIINMSSQAGFAALPSESVYCMTKAGIAHLTKCLAVEWGPHNITVNAVAPTFIHTPGTQPALADSSFRADVIDRIAALHRIGEPMEVAGAVVFLASPAASLITGHTLLIDGGWTAR